MSNKLWFRLGIATGVLLLLSSGVAVLAYLPASLAIAARLPVDAEVAVVVLTYHWSQANWPMPWLFDFIVGGLLVHHSYRSLMGHPSGPLHLPPPRAFWSVFLVTWMLGPTLLSFELFQKPLLPLLLLLSAALPVLAVTAWASRRLQAPLTWREATWLLLSGAMLSVPLARALSEGLQSHPLVSLIAFWSPSVIVAPLAEETAKAFGFYVLGSKWLLDERRVVLAGLLCGAGFSIAEGLGYIGQAVMAGGDGWSFTVLLRALGVVVHPLGTAVIALGWYRSRTAGPRPLLVAFVSAVGLHAGWNYTSRFLSDGWPVALAVVLGLVLLRAIDRLAHHNELVLTPEIPVPSAEA